MLLARIRALQTQTFDTDPRVQHGDALGDYVVLNIAALIAELGEVLHEVQWKPWAIERGKVWDDEKLQLELVDALIFLGNLMLAAGLDDKRLDLLLGLAIKKSETRLGRAGGYRGRDAFDLGSGHSPSEVRDGGGVLGGHLSTGDVVGTSIDIP